MNTEKRMSRADLDALMQSSIQRASRIVYEPRLAAAFAEETKTAIRQAAGQKGLNLEKERVSLWRESNGNFEYLASRHTLLEALQSTDRYTADNVFLLDAIGGETLIIVIPPTGGGA